jgi:hypothetical protein
MRKVTDREVERAMERLRRTKPSAVFNGDRLLTRYKAGEEMRQDELEVLVLYLTILLEAEKKAVDPLTAQGRLILLLTQIAFEIRPCKICGETLYMIRIRGRAEPYTKIGMNHRQEHPEIKNQVISE